MRILLSAYLRSDWIYSAGINAEHGKGQCSKDPAPLFIDSRGTPALRSSRPRDLSAVRLAHESRVDNLPYPVCFVLYATTSPAAKSGLGRSSPRFCCTHSSATLLLSSALS